jgi:hypothetical protein
MTAQPRARGRRSYKELFLSELKKRSGDEQKLINKRTLQKSLKWDEKRYGDVKAELVAEKQLLLVMVARVAQ